MPDIEPKVERVKFPKSAMMQVGSLQRDYQRGLMELADAVAEEKGLKPGDGWQFDPQSFEFVQTPSK